MKVKAVTLLVLLLFSLVAMLPAPSVKALSSTEHFTNGDFEAGDATGWSLSANCTIVMDFSWMLRVQNMGEFSQTFSSPIPISRIRLFCINYISVNDYDDCYFLITFTYSDSSTSSAYIDTDYVSWWYSYSAFVDLYTLMDTSKLYLTKITITYPFQSGTIYFDDFTCLTTDGGLSTNERIVDGGFETGEYSTFWADDIAGFVSSDNPHSGDYHLEQYSSPVCVLSKNFTTPLSIESMSTFHFYCGSWGYGTASTDFHVIFYYYSGSSEEIILESTFNSMYRYYDLLLYLDEGEEALSGFTIWFTSSSTWGALDDISLKADDYAPITVAGNDLLYFRSDAWNVTDELGYKLMRENTFSNSTASLTLGEGDTSVKIGVRVWRYDVFGTATEITGGSPDAVVSLGASYYGEKVGYFNCRKYSQIIDHIKVVVYMKSNTGEWQAKAVFLTGSGDDDIQNYVVFREDNYWAFHYWLNFTAEQYFEFQYGDRYSSNSYIQLEYPRADPWRVALARMQNHDVYGMVTAPWTWILGVNLFWTILYLGCLTFLIMKHGSYKMALLLTWILGGSGSLLWAIIPSSGLVAAAIMLAFAMAGTLFKIFHR